MVQITKKKKTAASLQRSDKPKGELQRVLPAQYNAVIQGARLNNLAIDESHFKVEAEYFAEREKRKFNFSRKIKKISTSSLESDGVVSAEILWMVRARVGRKVALKIDTTYTIVYDGLQGHSVASVSMFLNKVGPVATYAYFRAHVSQLSWSADAEMPILPVYSSL